MKKTKTNKEGVSFTNEQFEIMLNGLFDQIHDKVLDLVFNDTKECHELIGDMVNFIAQKVVNEEKLPISNTKLKAKVAKIVSAEGDGMAQSLIFSQVDYVHANPDECCGMCDECKTKAKTELDALGVPADFDKTRGLKGLN